MSISIIPFEPSSSLTGPRSASASGVEDEGHAVAGAGVDGRTVVTGGGRVALLDSARGVVSVWEGNRALIRSGPVLSVAGAILQGDELRRGGGGWERRLLLPSGDTMIERGLLPDVGDGIVLQWTVDPVTPVRHEVSPIPLEIRIPDVATSDAPLTLPVGSSGPASVLILLHEDGREATPRLLRPLAARESQRADRQRSGGEAGFRVMVNGAPDPGLLSALEAIDDALLQTARGSRATQVLGGVEGGTPRYLESSHLAEFGVAALMTGRRSSVRHVLETLVAEPDPPSLPLLHLAGLWAHWTGDPRPLQEIRPGLNRAAEALQPTDAVVALPSPRTVLRELLNAIEPLGSDSWNQELRTTLHRIEGGEPAPRRRTLPILGVPTPAEPAPAAPSRTSGAESNVRRPDLPDPKSFASPDHPAMLARRTVQGARILRSWVEGRIGAQPDASYGRLRVAPVIESEWESFDIEKLATGDALVSLRFHREGEFYHFRLFQEGGRVPVNLIFEPLLPVDEVRRVWIDGESADVEAVAEEGKVRLRFQLPLDGDREIRVEGATSGNASSPS